MTFNAIKLFELIAHLREEGGGLVGVNVNDLHNGMGLDFLFAHHCEGVLNGTCFGYCYYVSSFAVHKAFIAKVLVAKGFQSLELRSCAANLTDGAPCRTVPSRFVLVGA